MRSKKLQPKVLSKVIIPADLLDFLREVNILIEQNDEVTKIESDDLLQTKCAYGGLIEEGTDQYGFTYFPISNTRPKWEIELSAADISAIASEKITELALWKCQNISCGAHFTRPDDDCFDCDWVSDESERTPEILKNEILKKLSQSLTPEEWLKGYLSHYPDVHPLQIIGDYNSLGQVGEKWGFFSLESMGNLIEKLRA